MRKWMPSVLAVLLLLAFACSGTPEATPPISQTPPDENQETVIDSPIAAIDTPSMDTFPIATLLGKISPAKDTAFVLIAAKYTAKTGIYMRREAYAAFEKMHAAAAADGITLTIISAMRNFSDQKRIWEGKWSGKHSGIADPVERAKAILRYSSMPGSSRHHWGTDLDLNNLENDYFESGTGKKVYDWLTAHAAEHGFCQPYSAMGDDRPHGYQEEKWHWSYMPLAARYLKAYKAQVTLEDIGGFLGSETAGPLNIIEEYVGGIAPPCRDWQ